METLREYTNEMNRLFHKRADDLNDGPNRLFMAEHFDLPDDFFLPYFKEEYTFEEILEDMSYNAY
jgi:hypothetical protein